jgi:putative transposase
LDKTSRSPPIYYLKTPSVKEIERIALEEAERTSPKYAREKEIRRKGYAKYKFLKDSRPC